jgi:hypothetical protein
MKHRVRVTAFAFAVAVFTFAVVRTLMVGVPFFKHLAVHVRFLISLPLLIIAEIIVHRRIMSVVAQFSSRHLIGFAAGDYPGAADLAAFLDHDSII